MNNFFLSNSEIQDQIENGKPVIIKDCKISRETEEYFISVLERFLKYMGKEKIFDHLSYCLRELINNAKKANTKRVFFKTEKLDIFKPDDYETGMKQFKDKTISNIDYYLDLQEKENLYVQIYYQIKDPYFNIIISNNSPILEQEKNRIVSKLLHAKTFNSVEDAFQTVMDDTEGAGLGIVILVLMLRKIGIYDKNFAIVQEDNTTHVRIAVPLSLVTEEDIDILSEVLIKEIDSVPQFPENIRILTGMLENTDADFRQISELIKKDPGLTIDTLKMANSAHYRRLNKIEKIELAVSIIGVKGLKYLLQSYGIKKALAGKYTVKDLELIWKHSYEVAQITSVLCDIFNKTDLGEHAYVGGLLHDIGKIVLVSIHEKTMDKITRFCMDKNISVNIIENLLDGANHFQVGGRMAEKWGLPKTLIDIIKGQSNPYGINEESREVTKIVYLANILNNKLSGSDEYLSYESMLLSDFKIDDEQILNKLLEKIKIRLSKQQ